MSRPAAVAPRVADQRQYRAPPSSRYALCVPLILVTFRATVLPRAAGWSRDRAIQHSAALIAQIESFRQRRGHYPVSLQSRSPDFPTGVVGIERFHYEPNGEAYNLFFVRAPHRAGCRGSGRVQPSGRALLHRSRVGHPSVRRRAAEPALRRPAAHTLGPPPLDFDPSRLRRFRRVAIRVRPNERLLHNCGATRCCENSTTEPCRDAGITPPPSTAASTAGCTPPQPY
jgi:hypothetical protein